MKILFLHGWQSVPGGVKPTFLAEHGHTVFNPKLPDEDFDEAVRIAQAEFDRHAPQVIVGSSRGGAVAMNIASAETKLVLLCPAWRKYGLRQTLKSGCVVLHSRADDVVPFADSEELVVTSRMAHALIETGNDHRLADPASLEIMRSVCTMGGEYRYHPNLNEFLTRDWNGQSHAAALRWVEIAQDFAWSVIHGSILNSDGQRVDRAWCACGGIIVDLLLPVGERILERVRYDQSYQPIVTRAYQSDGALYLAFKFKHPGPWPSSG